jgi:hypothetical protein
MDRIEGHVGSQVDAKFKLKWKSGDVTWMPYYQIAHLDALGSYFELLGIDKIEDLPAGTSTKTDSYRDPQIFLGGLEMSPAAILQGLNRTPHQ